MPKSLDETIKISKKEEFNKNDLVKINDPKTIHKKFRKAESLYVSKVKFEFILYFKKEKHAQSFCEAAGKIPESGFALRDESIVTWRNDKLYYKMHEKIKEAEKEQQEAAAQQQKINEQQAAAEKNKQEEINETKKKELLENSESKQSSTTKTSDDKTRSDSKNSSPIIYSKRKHRERKPEIIDDEDGVHIKPPSPNTHRRHITAKSMSGSSLTSTDDEDGIHSKTPSPETKRRHITAQSLSKSSSFTSHDDEDGVHRSPEKKRQAPERKTTGEQDTSTLKRISTPFLTRLRSHSSRSLKAPLERRNSFTELVGSSRGKENGTRERKK